MATVLQTTYKHTLQWAELVKSSVEEGFTGLDRMIQTGLVSTTGTLAAIPFIDPTSLAWKEKITQLLIETASYAKRSTDYTPLSLKVFQIQLMANENSDASLVAQAIHKTIQESRDLFPRTEEEIRQLIKEKRQLNELNSVFTYCDRAIKSSEEASLTKQQVIVLQNELATFKNQTFPALQKVSLILEEKMRKILAPQPAPKKIESAQRKQEPSSYTKAWNLFTRCTRSFFSLFSRLFS